MRGRTGFFSMRTGLAMLCMGTVTAACAKDDKPGVEGIYVDCEDGVGAPAVRIHEGPLGVVIRAPERWTGADPGYQDGYVLSDVTSDTDYAMIFITGRRHVGTEADVQRILEYTVTGTTNVRHFEIDGHPAVAGFSKFTQTGPGCMGCEGRSQALVAITVGVAKDDSIVTFAGSAPVDASKPTFCELQATLATIRW